MKSDERSRGIDSDKHLLVLTHVAVNALRQAVPGMQDADDRRIHGLVLAAIRTGERVKEWDTYLGKHELIRVRLAVAGGQEFELELVWGKEVDGRPRYSRQDGRRLVYLHDFREGSDSDGDSG